MKFIIMVIKACFLFRGVWSSCDGLMQNTGHLLLMLLCVGVPMLSSLFFWVL